MKNTAQGPFKIVFFNLDISTAMYSSYIPVRETIELKSIYCSMGRLEACWLVFDLMDIDKTNIDVIKKQIAVKCKIGNDHIHILSTHNHGGGEINDFDIDALAKMAVASVLKAEKNAKSAYVSYGETCINEQLNYNRRFYSKELKSKTTVFWGPCPQNNYDCSDYLACNIQNIKERKTSYSGKLQTNAPERKLPSGDNRLQILFFEEDDGTPIGSICRFAAHAVCCNSPDYYSSDYPYYVRKTLEKELGGTAVFMNGPCGEIAPGVLNKQSGMERRIGLKIGQLATKLIKEAQREKIESFSDYSLEVRLPLRKELLKLNLGSEIKAVKQRLQESASIPLPELKRLAEYDRLLSTIDFLKQKATGGREQIVTLGKITINDITIMAFPGEIFSSTAENAIKRKNGEKIITVTEHDGTAMYIVPPNEYHLGGYETTCCMVSANAEQILVKAIQNFKES